MAGARVVLRNPAASEGQSLRIDTPLALLIAANTIGAVCILTSIFGWLGLPGRAILNDVSFEALMSLSAFLFVRSALSQPGRWRRPWLLVSAGLFAALVGSLVSIVYSAIQGNVPTPSVADVFYLAFYPLVMAGLLRFPRAVTTRAEAMSFAMDAVAVLFGSGMIVAHFLIVPTLESTNGSLPSLLVSAAYPLGDVLLFFGLMSIVVGRRSLPRDASIAALAGALVTQVVVDLLVDHQTLTGSSGGQALITCMAAVTWILVAWAGYERLHKKYEDGADREITIPSMFAYLVAYVAALAGFGVLLFSARGILGTPLGAMILAAVAVTPLLLARQVLALRESGTLHELKGTHETEERYRSLVNNSSDTIFVTDEETTIQYATPSAQSVLGYAAEALSGCRLSELVHPDDLQPMLSLVSRCAGQTGSSARGEWRISDQEGTWHYTETVVANLLEDPHVRSLVFTSRDIGERIRFQNELQHQAFHDALTGLANRVLFKDRVEHALARVARTEDRVAVLFMDIDDFKLVNDSYGHVTGDKLLVQVAERLSGILRASDTAARLGGDEFAILLEGDGHLDEACRVAERALALFDENYRLDSAELAVSVSIGVAVSDGSHTSAQELLRDADVAMYSAKAHGKDRLEVFEAAMQAAVYERLELATELRQAVDNEEFVVYYQPIVDIVTERIVGTEALVRWNHPRQGLLLPARFINVAEETGLILPIGDVVLDQACRQLRSWDDRFPGSSLGMSVNLSPRQLKDPELPAKVRGALASSGINPAQLTLEITETALVEDSHATLARLRELKALGIRLSIDDFGTGYSSLSYLRQFPVDGVKIAKPFVDHVAEGDDQSALARAIITLGETLRLEVVAEGIEREQQMRELRELGCKLGQGYYSSRPVDAGHLTELLTKH
jgi:diguanylate cyclase (GGDEF)-like protein/PAS domain S-box-containing protein